MFIRLSVNGTDYIANILSNIAFANHTAARKFCIPGKVNYSVNANAVHLNATYLSQSRNGELSKRLPKRF